MHIHLNVWVDGHVCFHLQASRLCNLWRSSDYAHDALHVSLGIYAKMTLEEPCLSMQVQMREHLRSTVETWGQWDGFVWRDEGRGFVKIGWFITFVIVLLSPCSCPSTLIGERVCVCVGVGLRVESGEDG